MENLEVFERLTVISKRKINRATWATVRCICGTVKEVRMAHLKSKVQPTRSCGCLAKDVHFNRRGVGIKHGMTSSVGKSAPIYGIWVAMRERCSNPKAKKFHNYGGRGIKVCERWMDFRNFYADMGDRPEGKSLDRIDNDGDYCPENCRWATLREQGLNRRKTVKVIYNGIETPLVTVAEIEKVPYINLYALVRKRKKPIDVALNRIKEGMANGTVVASYDRRNKSQAQQWERLRTK